MDQVLEHVVDPLETLQSIATILKSPTLGQLGGRLVLSVPNPNALGRYFFQRRWLGWHLPYHRHFYTRKSISILAEQSGFIVETIQSATKSQFLLAGWVFLFCAGKKGKKSADVFQTWGRFDSQIQKRWDIALYFLLEKIRLLALPMRMADLMGIGDWNLIILRKR